MAAAHNPDMTGQMACPHGVYPAGYDYLFRVHYATAETHVFRSERAYDSTSGAARDKSLGRIATTVREAIVDGEGMALITSNHNLARETIVCQ